MDKETDALTAKCSEIDTNQTMNKRKKKKIWNRLGFIYPDIEIETRETLKFYEERNIISGICKILSKISFFLVEHSLFRILFGDFFFIATLTVGFFFMFIHLQLLKKKERNCLCAGILFEFRVSYPNFQSLKLHIFLFGCVCFVTKYIASWTNEQKKIYMYTKLRIWRHPYGKLCTQIVRMIE